MVTDVMAMRGDVCCVMGCDDVEVDVRRQPTQWGVGRGLW